MDPGSSMANRNGWVRPVPRLIERADWQLILGAGNGAKTRRRQRLQPLRFGSGQKALQVADKAAQVPVPDGHPAGQNGLPFGIHAGQEAARSRRRLPLLGGPPAEGLVQAGEGPALLPVGRLHCAVGNVVQGFERVALEERVDVLEAVSALGAASLGQVFSHADPVAQPVLPNYGRTRMRPCTIKKVPSEKKNSIAPSLHIRTFPCHRQKKLPTGMYYTDHRLVWTLDISVAEPGPGRAEM
jgi:hypothetical protein